MKQFAMVGLGILAFMACQMFVTFDFETQVLLGSIAAVLLVVVPAVATLAYSAGKRAAYGYYDYGEDDGGEGSDVQVVVSDSRTSVFGGDR